MKKEQRISTYDRESWKEQEWHEPVMEEELGELERVSEALGISLDSLKEAFAKGRLGGLSHESWVRMQNSDSRDEKWDDVSEIERHLADREGQSRDVRPVVQAMESNESLPAPIVLQKDGTLHLVAGNTRLLASRAMKRKPKVFVIEI